MSQFDETPRKSLLKRSLINLAESGMSDIKIKEQLMSILQNDFKDEVQAQHNSNSQYGDH